jgi:hypothetical protein
MAAQGASHLGRLGLAAEDVDLALLASRLAMDGVLKALQQRLQVIDPALERGDAGLERLVPLLGDGAAPGRLGLVRVSSTLLDHTIQ